ncbi:hypothetical protein GLOIN_2v1580557 [Rhizophagus clarus]|uniref:Crinkler effector protein N-terminal domain-containing protein n=1 Tax=Rhizophagus clarus TaxID=94130 RepID=A0A8H3R277_9GLOM|nr:hypothetical protein GLOIN_2v1580557 [Rhizophagus clarus]
MSITLLCLVKGNTTASAFAVDIDREKLISRLKEAIKENQKPFFDNTSSKNIKLWKVEISGDHDDQLKNLSLHDIGDYWSEKPTKKSIYVIILRKIIDAFPKGKLPQSMMKCNV